MMQREVFSEKGGVITRKISYNTTVFANFIENCLRLTMNFSRRGIWDIIKISARDTKTGGLAL